MTVPPRNIGQRVDVLTGFAEEASERGECFFYVRIPAPLQPLERGERFEDPLHEVLSAAGVGEVAGGGSQLDEVGEIVYCGIDVYVNDRARGLDLLRSTLKQLGVPDGTVVEEFLPDWSELPL